MAKAQKFSTTSVDIKDYSDMSEFFLSAQHIISQIPGIVAWKDLRSNYLGCNNAASELSGFKNPADLVGKNDFSLQEKIVECAHIFLKQDQKVIHDQLGIKVFGVHVYNGNIVRTLYTQKQPFYGVENKLIGTVFNCNIITDEFLVQLGKHLIQADSKYVPCKKSPQCSYIIDGRYDKKITERESECLFYLLRGRTAAEIGAILKISKRTVETHIINIKYKMNCETKSQLIEKSLYLGYLYILPKNLSPQNLSITLK